MKKTKYGFRQFIATSLPLPTTKVGKVRSIRKGDTVFYLYKETKKYGRAVVISEDRLYAYWLREHSPDSWGYMPINTLFIETDKGDLPIIDVGIHPELYMG